MARIHHRGIRAGEGQRPTLVANAICLVVCALGACRGQPAHAPRAGLRDAHRVYIQGPTRTIEVDEEDELRVRVLVRHRDRNKRLFPVGLPPGATWSEAEKRIVFRPDSIQGGGALWTVRFYFGSRQQSMHRPRILAGALRLVVHDTISPPTPRVIHREKRSDHQVLDLEQSSDTFLDSPGFAGTKHLARVTIPKRRDKPLPVRVVLHGMGDVPAMVGVKREFRIYPSDQFQSYWWGYGDQLPAGSPTSGSVPDYTARRVLHLLEWLLRNYPAADADRVYVTGGSMGASGALMFGLLHARHIAMARGDFGQTIARFHRPDRVDQLQELWGEPASNLPTAERIGVWDRHDITAILSAAPDDRFAVRGATSQYLMSRFAKDDRTVYFGALVSKSPLSRRSFFEVLQHEGIGHYIVWDEGGHMGQPDPILGSHWWKKDGWDPIHDAVTYLHRARPFPAFSASSADPKPGTHSPALDHRMTAMRNMAGDAKVAGDTRWSGDYAGIINRYLRWDTTAIVDTFDTFEIPLRLARPAPPKSCRTNESCSMRQYPDQVTARVTPRRLRYFRCLPGERLAWKYGTESGFTRANAQGVFAIDRLQLTSTWTTLRVVRVPSF